MALNDHTNGELSPIDLPHLDRIFDKLRRGHHICTEDGDLFGSLRDHREGFTELFTKLGFTMVAHRRDFFYFHTRHSPSERATKMALFVMILAEWLSDRGEPIEDTLLTHVFTMSELPHLGQERYAATLAEADAGDESQLAGIVRNLVRFGFAEHLSENTFRFRPPVCRFLDICLDVLAESDEETKADETESAEAGEVQP